MGRPTDYKDEYNELAFNFSLLGATDQQMAGFFDVSESTLNLWKKKHPKFSESLKDGKSKADGKVARSLYHRACGFRYDEVTYEKSKTGGLGIKLKKDQVEEIKAVDTYKTKIVTKEIVPDTAACMIWLKNRAGWRDSRDTDGNIGNAEEYFKAIADAIGKSDTNPDTVIP